MSKGTQEAKVPGKHRVGTEAFLSPSTLNLELWPQALSFCGTDNQSGTFAELQTCAGPSGGCSHQDKDTVPVLKQMHVTLKGGVSERGTRVLLGTEIRQDGLGQLPSRGVSKIPW